MFQRLSVITNSRLRLFQRQSSAFTLVELTMTMVILSVTATLFVNSLIVAVQGLSMYQQRQKSVFMVQFAEKRLLKDCRYLKRGTITQADTSRLDFEDAYGRFLSFKFVSPNLLMSVDGGVTYYTLSEGIGSVTFRYYNKNNTVISTPVVPGQLGNIQWLDINVTGNPALLNYSETIQVFPREMFR